MKDDGALTHGDRERMLRNDYIFYEFWNNANGIFSWTECVYQVFLVPVQLEKWVSPIILYYYIIIYQIIES